MHTFLHWLAEKALAFIVWVERDSNLVKHARRELHIAGHDSPDAFYAVWWPRPSRSSWPSTPCSAIRACRPASSARSPARRCPTTR